MFSILKSISVRVPVSTNITNTSFGTVSGWVNSSGAETTPSDTISCAILAGSMKLRPNVVTFTTTTASSYWMAAEIKMYGLAADASSILFSETLGRITDATMGTKGGTFSFTLPNNIKNYAHYLYFSIAPISDTATNSTKRTCAGRITIDSFYALKTTGKVGSIQPAGLPNITGSIRYDVWAGKPHGAFYNNGGGKRNGTASDNASGSTGATKGFDASRSDQIYGNSATVRPESIATQFLLKY